MINRQLYTMKFMSSRLKKFNYNIEIDYYEALENKEIVALSDSQMLRTIRDVVLEKTGDTNRILDRDLLENFYNELDSIRKRKDSIENRERLKGLKKKIIKMCYIPEYITIVIEHNKHYDDMYYKGLIINGIQYYRISVSAGQGRVSTVTFCSGDVLEAVNEILDNGRDKNSKFSPSKFNAYKGTYCSASKVVTTPRFCVVPDYESDDSFMVNWVTETEGEQDDLIESREITKSFNRWDGMGLISPTMAEIWSKDLGIDYIPSQFCVRQSFVKGLLDVFPFHEFCEKKNNTNYITKSIYKDENGDNISIDLRDYDVILTESQFKLWNSYPSLDSYKENCEKHNLKWGASLYTDKEINNTLKMNYQFLQVNNIKKEDIPKLCEEFVDWIDGVNTDDENNIYYTLLFLLGRDVTKSAIENYLKNSNNYWIKSLIVNNSLINDKYIKEKIYNLIKTKIDNGCLGAINVRGNYQPLVSDPYGMMEYLCGMEVKGLLGSERYYSNYWNNKKDKNGNHVNKIIGMRAPLTYRSEILPMELDNTEEQKYWYRYNYAGIIVNIHGHETDNWAGSDYDFDILATTDNEILTKSVFKNEYPVVYEAPKPEKKIFTDEDLFKSDKFTFGSIIGAITNKSTSGVALLDILEELYGLESREYKTTLNRIKMCTKLQSAQIDKAKIGRDVKGIPKTWTDRKYIDEMDISEEEKIFLKKIMLDRHPRFFIHLYPDTKSKYNKYLESYELSSLHKFGIELKDLLDKENKTDEEMKFIESYYMFMPVIDSNSVMNNISKYIESIDFNIKQKINKSRYKDIHLILMRNEIISDSKMYEKILLEYKQFIKELNAEKKLKSNKRFNGKYNEEESEFVNRVYEKFKDVMDKQCSNTSQLVDNLIHIFYVENPSANKDILWNSYGEYIFRNIKDKNQNTILFPMPKEGGSIVYLNDSFEPMEVEV